MDQSSYIAWYSYSRIIGKDVKLQEALSYDYDAVANNEIGVQGKYKLYIADDDRNNVVRISVEGNEKIADDLIRRNLRMFGVPSSHQGVIDFVGVERKQGFSLDVFLKSQPNSRRRVVDRDILACAVCDTAIEPLIKLLLKR